MAVKGLLEAALKTGGKAVSDAIEKAKYDRSEFDPRFFPGKTVRVKDFPEKRPDVINTNTMIPYQRLALQDLVGRPYLTTMSDRIAAGGILEGIGNKPLAHPLRLTGGQDYMRENPGKVWASAENVVPDMEKAANELKAEFGQSPVYLPWRMTPSGGDFAHLTGQTMLSWAAANMPKAVKKQLDKDMKQLIPDWAGVDDPKSLLQYGNLKDTQRKAVMNMMDVNYRNQGGISQTQARLAVADQSQLLSPDSGFQNVGEIDLSRGTLAGEGNLTYPSALAGEYKGTLDTDVTAMDLNPQRYARKRKKDGTFDTGPQGPDYLSTREVPRRAMEVGYWGGLIDEPLLKSLSEKGFKVDSPAAVGLLSGAGALAALAPQEAEAGPAGLLRNVFPAPQRMFDPSDNAYKPFLESFGQTPGGRYLEMGPEGPKDITGEYPASATLGVGPDGKPKFQVAPEQATNIPEPKGPGRKIKTNLAKKKTGWKWTQAPEGYDPDPDGGFPIVSVNDGKDHYYTLNTDFPEGVELARYPNEASEPRLKPTRKGHVNLGKKVGEIEMRGKKHPVYDNITIRQAAPVAMTGLLGAGMSEESDASLAKLAARGLEVTDIIDPEDSRVGEYFLSQPDSTKSIGVLRTDYASDSGFDEGYMASQLTEIAPEYRRQGLARELYDAAEELSGNRLVPSTTLSPDGAAMWNSRDRELLEQVQDKMGRDNYDTVESVLYPEGRGPGPVKLAGFDRAYAVPAAGLLTAAETAEPREYREAPVVQEQSFGDMVNEYAQINQRAQAAEAQKFDTLMREDARLRDMGSAAFGQVSPELAAYRRSQMLPTIGEIGVGALEGAVDTVDFVSQLPTAISTMTMPKRTPLRDRLGGLLDYSFVDERDQRARDQARLIGGLLSPI